MSSPQLKKTLKKKKNKDLNKVKVPFYHPVALDEENTIVSTERRGPMTDE